jgi:hypothetical protein
VTGGFEPVPGVHQSEIIRWRSKIRINARIIHTLCITWRAVIASKSKDDKFVAKNIADTPFEFQYEYVCDIISR